MNNTDIKQVVSQRLADRINEVKQGQNLVNDVLLGQFWKGKLSAIEGETGEQKFLEWLMDNLDG